MDALAEFTAMSPPRAKAEPSASDEESSDERVGGRSSQQLDESFTSQSSADPRAFDGLRDSRGAVGEWREARVPLALGLRARDARVSLGDADGHFQDLFSADTQDEEGLLAAAEASRAGLQGRHKAVGGRSQDAAVDSTPRPAPAAGNLHLRQATPPPSLLASVDRARALKTNGFKMAMDSPDRRARNERRTSGAGSSELSEDLVQFGKSAGQFIARAPPKLQLQSPKLPLQSPKMQLRSPSRALPAAGRQAKPGKARVQNQESDGSDTEMENERGAQPTTATRAAKMVRDDSDETAVSDTGTEPYVPSDDDGMEEETELLPEPEPARPANPVDVTDSDSGKDSVEPRASIDYDTEEPEARGFSEPGEEDDEYPPTQPSKAFFGSNSLSGAVEDEALTVAPKMSVEGEQERVSPAKMALKKRDKSAASSQAILSESQERSYDFVASQCKCENSKCECEAGAEAQLDNANSKSSSTIRNLEFSFAMPESQDTEMSEKMDSTPDIGVAAAKVLQAFDLEDSENIPKATAKKPRARKSETTPKKASRDNTPSKSKKSRVKSTANDTLTQESRSSSVESTPVLKRKRRRVYTASSASKDSDDSSSEAPSSVAEGTPHRAPRRTGRLPTSQSTPSSSQKARTRAKLLSPLPSNRAYLSRSRTIFKFKFEFVLTGFVKDGEASLTELIQEHGGKVVGREHETLYPGNSKAVVIATPVSWRKLKFMHAVACGIPVVHPDWIQQCIKAASILPFNGFTVPSGYSLTTRKFECFPVQKLSVFSGYSYGIASDVSDPSAQPKEMVHLIAASLKACGASIVHENLSKNANVDIVLCSEHTEICDHYARRRVPVKNFSWVTECIILQRFIEPSKCDFKPQRLNQDKVLWAMAAIGNEDRTLLKLHVGELILADLSRNGIDHFLLFHVCEILDIYLVRDSSGESKKRRTEDAPKVMLRVGVLKRSPYSAGLSRSHSRILEIPSTQVKRRVVAVSKTDFEELKYRDESVFFFEDEDEEENHANESKDESEDETSSPTKRAKTIE